MGQREYTAVARSLTGYRPSGNSPGRTTEAAPFALISPKAIACSTAHSRGPRLCGIWAGIFTATEAAAVAALWALLIGLVWYRNLSLSGQRAFYYGRVLEIPTPRWTAYDAKYYGVRIASEVPTSVQERAYTSSIWYSPSS